MFEGRRFGGGQLSDIKLFRLTQGMATELQGDASDLEKPLQTLIENNLEPQKKDLKLYAAFKRLKNFATVALQKNRFVLYLHLNPGQLDPLPAIARDVRQSGHWGTGDLELVIASAGDLDLAKPLIRMAYEERGNR